MKLSAWFAFLMAGTVYNAVEFFRDLFSRPAWCALDAAFVVFGAFLALDAFQEENP